MKGNMYLNLLAILKKKKLVIRKCVFEGLYMDAIRKSNPLLSD